MNQDGCHPDYRRYRLSFWLHTQAINDWGIMAFIGDAVGEAAKKAREKHAIESLVKRLGDLKLIASIVWDGEDRPEREDRNTTVADVAVSILENRWCKGSDELDEIINLDQLVQAYGDAVDSGGAHLISLLTRKAFRERKAEQERKELEHSAAAFAQQCGHPVDSYQFIHALRREIRRVERRRNQWNNPEVRMEEWAAVRYQGLGSEVYFDDLNFENGRYSSHINGLRAILRWLRKECPLLMAKYREKRRRRKALS